MAVLLVAGCFQEDVVPPASNGLVNDTSIVIRVSQLVDSREEHRATLVPGTASGWVFRDAVSVSRGLCIIGDLVLRDDIGGELGRIRQPFCYGEAPVYLSHILPGVPTASPVP
jgi:hypothetical protein